MNWQPIETAPENELFLAYKPGCVQHLIARVLHSDHPDCEYDGGVHEHWSHKFVTGVTHWMPLPEPPK